MGLEQSQLWSQLGVTVTIVGRFAPHAEPELAARLKDAFTTDGITVVEQRAGSVASTTDGVTVTTGRASGSLRRGCLWLPAAGPALRASGWTPPESRPTTGDS